MTSQKEKRRGGSLLLIFHFLYKTDDRGINKRGEKAEGRVCERERKEERGRERERDRDYDINEMQRERERERKPMMYV